MTDYSPSLSVTVDGVAVTDLIDWSMDFYRGSSGPYSMPQAGSGSLTMLYTDTPKLVGNIGSKIVVTLADDGSGVSQPIWTGWVSDVQVAHLAYGAAGHITSVSYTMTGPLSLLVSQEYTLDATSTMDTAAAVTDVLNFAGTTSWNEVQPDLTWTALDPTATWAGYDLLYSTRVTATVTGSGFSTTRTAGDRVVTTDLEDLFNGSHSIVTETPQGGLTWTVGATVPTAVTLAPGAILTDIGASVSKSDMRNQVTATLYDGTTSSFWSVDTSVRNYGQLAGSVATLLNNTGDATTIATYMAKGLSEATVGITSFSVDVLNPNMTAVERAACLDGVNGVAFSLSGLDAVFGETTVIVWGQSWSISRDQFRIQFQVTPESRFNASPTWNAISPAYTWTSYGTAFPTQKWSDL